MAKKKTLDQDFFKTWTADMAYVLGFFAADGNMIRNKRGACFISFHITDKIILGQIRRVLGSNHKIAVRDRGARYKLGYRLQIGSKEYFEDLSSFGFTPNKSMKMTLPDVPAACFGDFVRGYFDGDGCVYLKKLKVADRKNEKWIFSSRFTAGSRTFLDPLLAALRARGVKGGFVVAKKSGFELVLSHRDSLALYRLMYDTMAATDIYLPRKYRIFRKAVDTLYADMRP